MARRARQRIGIIKPALQHIEKRGLGQPGGQRRDLVAIGAKGRAQAQLATALGAFLAECVDIAGRMDAQDIFLRGGGGAGRSQLAHQPGHLDQIAKAALRLGVFGQARAAGGLHQPTDRHQKAVIAT